MSQRSDQPAPDPISVGLVVDEGSNPFEMACACEIFGARRRAEIGYEPYRLQLVSPEPSVVVRDGLFTVTGSADLSALDHVHTVIVPNRPDVASPSRKATLDALVRAHDRGARMVGLCTGAYTLAEAGLLDGRPAAVHWQLADDFARRFPSVRVEPDVLFVDDGDVLTSAGSAAALDLGLHIVRKDHGAEVANFVSRRPGAPGRTAGRRSHRRPRTPEPRHAAPPVPQRGRHHPADVADDPARAARQAAAGTRRRGHGPGGASQRPRHHRQPASADAQAHGPQPFRLPDSLPVSGVSSSDRYGPRIRARHAS
jgi:AraC family transcriptional activator FtrA